MADLGRPSDYTPEIASKIIELMVEGKSLRAICRMDGMPSVTSVFRWKAAHPDFREQYDDAMIQRAHTLVEETLSIADEEVGYTDSGATDGGAVQNKRLRVDTRKWIASKVLPKLYGDKITQEVTGADGQPMQMNITVKFDE